METKPGRGALPRTRPAAGLVQPRALRPALCSPLSSDQKREQRHSDLWAAGQAGGGPGPEGLPPGPPGATTPHGIGEQRRSPAAGGTMRNSGKASARCHGRGKQEQTEGRRPGSARSVNKGLEGGGPGGVQDAQGPPGRGAAREARRGGGRPGQRLRDGTGPLYRGVSAMTQMNLSVRRKQDPRPREQLWGCQGGGVAGKFGGGG